MNAIEIKSNSGKLSATLFEVKDGDTVLIVASATGVRQEFYQKFAHYMSNNGVSVITFDYYGIGRSLTQPIKDLSNNAADWGKSDLESVIQYVMTNYSDSKKVILGHSIGGQLVGLAKSATEVDKIVLVAAQSGYWKFWEGMGKIKMWFNWYVLFPVLISLFGYLNSKKLSGMENLPKNVAKQWRSWGKRPEYIQSDQTITRKYFDQIETEVSAFGIADDQFAPLKAVEWMTNQYRNAKVKSAILHPEDFNVKRIGHFGIFKEKFKESIWRMLLDEIK